MHSVIVGVFGGVREGTKFDARYEKKKKNLRYNICENYSEKGKEN